MISFCYFQKKNWASFWAWPILAQFLSKQGPRRAIFNSFTIFLKELQHDNISYKYQFNALTYLNRNQQKKSKVGKTKG